MSSTRERRARKLSDAIIEYTTTCSSRNKDDLRRVANAHDVPQRDLNKAIEDLEKECLKDGKQPWETIDA
jgi:hypothetical protein